MATKKSSGTKYGPAASKSVEREMKAFKEGKLKSGSGAKVTNPKQAIAIGLSEARESGAKMPPPPAKSAQASAKKITAKKTAKKAAAKKSAKKAAANK
jgi:hypothetical protein